MINERCFACARSLVRTIGTLSDIIHALVAKIVPDIVKFAAILISEIKFWNVYKFVYKMRVSNILIQYIL